MCSDIADDVFRSFVSILFFAVSLVGIERFYKTWFTERLRLKFELDRHSREEATGSYMDRHHN